MEALNEITIALPGRDAQFRRERGRVCCVSPRSYKSAIELGGGGIFKIIEIGISGVCQKIFLNFLA